MGGLRRGHAARVVAAWVSAGLFSCAAAREPDAAPVIDPELAAFCMRGCERSNQCRQEAAAEGHTTISDCAAMCQRESVLSMLRERRAAFEACLPLSCEAYDTCTANIVDTIRRTPPP